MLTDDKLGILERFGSDDIQELCAEVRRLRKIEKIARLVRDDLKRKDGDGTLHVVLEAEMDNALGDV